MARRFHAFAYFRRKKRRARIAGMPVMTEAPSISGTEEVGETLSCSNGTWTNSPISYAYEWRRDDEIIDGATESDYELVEDDDAAEINCTVRARNRNGTTGATSEAVGPITTP